ncbi:MAG: AAA family ATPase [Flavobacteriales bacterium]|nr:AAA family ATPase [Flavobacteriales bacterium]
MQLRKANRKNTSIKMALQGPSGSGKTYSALLLAYGITKDWSKIAVIDSENGSAELYTQLGDYNCVPIQAPYTPEKYIEAIELCNKSNIEAIIIDSISHEWDSQGGILDIHGNMLGNSFTNWAKVTPRHNAFVNNILTSKAHIIATIRTKQDYVLSEKNGKMVPEKVGLKAITRDGVDYEFTLVLDINIKHNAVASKDRTNLFMDKPEFRINEKTGEKIKQ